MSRNIELNAKRGRHMEQCSLWQTPTQVTLNIEKSAEPFEVYRDWAMSTSVCKEDKVEHIKYVRSWLWANFDQGYAVRWTGG